MFKVAAKQMYSIRSLKNSPLVNYNNVA